MPDDAHLGRAEGWEVLGHRTRGDRVTRRVHEGEMGAARDEAPLSLGDEEVWLSKSVHLDPRLAGNLTRGAAQLAFEVAAQAIGRELAYDHCEDDEDHEGEGGGDAGEAPRDRPPPRAESHR